MQETHFCDGEIAVCEQSLGAYLAWKEKDVRTQELSMRVFLDSVALDDRGRLTGKMRFGFWNLHSFQTTEYILVKIRTVIGHVIGLVIAHITLRFIFTSSRMTIDISVYISFSTNASLSQPCLADHSRACKSEAAKNLDQNTNSKLIADACI